MQTIILILYLSSFLLKHTKTLTKKNSLENLTDTAKYFFYMIFQFAKLKGKKKQKQIKIIIEEDQLHELTTDTWRIFQLYFYKNLFNPLSNSKILNDKFLSEKQKKHY